MNKNLDQFIQVRLSDYEKNRIKYLADRFAGGNMSLWVVYSALNAPRKKIKWKDIDRYKKAPTKG